MEGARLSKDYLIFTGYIFTVTCAGDLNPVCTAYVGQF